MRSYYLYTLIFWALSLLSCAQENSDKEDFTLWQLPSQVNTIGNSYIIKSDNQKIIVIDGGDKAEENYLRGFLAAMGNEVHAWIISHPHDDHVGTLNEILKNPKDLLIHKIYQSRLSDAQVDMEGDSKDFAFAFYDLLQNSGIPVVEVMPGDTFHFGKTTCKILAVRNEDFIINPYNNSSVVVKIWDPNKSVLFLGDAGEEEGDRLLNGPFRNELNCDYIQMAHHGQQGVSKDFYRTVKFSACLWPTPSWVYNNDIGGGFNSYTLTTIEIRNLIDSLGIKENHISFQGLTKIE